jgi:molecular chaperone DnaJ
MPAKDYYIILGVSRGADLEKIKKAYRRGVKNYHPDTTQSAEGSERFLEIKEAYDTLSDTAKRAAYDRKLEQQGSLPLINRAPERVVKRRDIFNRMDIFSSAADEFFSGMVPGFFDRDIGRRKYLYLEMILTPEEAREGGTFPLTVPVVEACPRCRMTGVWDYFYCPVCYGYGRVRSQREFSVSIPPNVAHDTQVNLSLEDIGLRDVDLHVRIVTDFSEEEW